MPPDGQRVALPPDTARMLNDARRWSQQLERIEALSRKLSRSRDVTAVAEAVASEIASVIDWHGLRFFVVGDDDETLQAVVLRSSIPHYASETPERLRIQIGRGIAGHVAASRVAEIVPDVRRDPRGEKIAGTDDVDESMIVVPLVYEDHVLGVLQLIRLGREAFDGIDLRLAEIVAAQAAVALSNARQLEELERRGAALERRLASQRQLLAITERLVLTRDQNQIFDAIADTLADVVPHDTLTIYLVDRAHNCLVPVYARDEYADAILATRPALGEGLTGNIIETGEAEIINDTATDPRAVDVPGTPQDDEEALIVAPVRSLEGVIGALNLYRRETHFDDEDLELVKLFANHVAIALENAAAHQRLISAAVTDPLTGLPNRRLFADRVGHALARRGRSHGQTAVLFLDLDRFKLVNDGLGHAAGDAVLRAVAARLRENLRASDTVARLGGDEFGILLEEIATSQEAVLTGQRVINSLSEPLELDGREVSVRASVGIALDRGDDDEVTADELLRDADTAMYRAKANGRGVLAVFEPSMLAHQLARLQLDAELRSAIERGQLTVVYQPIVDLATGVISAVEALVRWNHPTRGKLAPSDFIGVSEESGQIVAIGAWVLNEACQQARRWQLAHRGAPRLRVCVNTSAREVMEPGFVSRVESALAATGLAADCLTLEITESMMLGDENMAISALHELRRVGVHVVIDDFGTGYSALSRLNQLPVDGLKIDRSFVQGLGSEREKTAIVSATIAFAQGLGLEVTAEGIETAEQLKQLMALDCGLGQGYFFARPLDASTMTEALAQPYVLDGSAEHSHAVKDIALVTSVDAAAVAS
jgi:diguanylate cyclase (GGDEF)-like protein